MKSPNVEVHVNGGAQRRAFLFTNLSTFSGQQKTPPTDVTELIDGVRWEIWGAQPGSQGFFSNFSSAKNLGIAIIDLVSHFNSLCYRAFFSQALILL